MRRLATLLLVAPLTACGLHPLYADGAGGPVARALARVEVAQIEGNAGRLMSNALRDRFAVASDGAAPLYRLDVKLDDEITGYGVRPDDAVTRERRRIRARYQLVDLEKGTVLLDATAGSDEGIDVISSSEYATIAAENTALERLSGIVADQIVTRLATRARSTP